MDRMTVFSHDVTARLEVRPTIDHVRKILTAQDMKIDAVELSLKEHMSRLDSEQEA